MSNQELAVERSYARLLFMIFFMRDKSSTVSIVLFLMYFYGLYDAFMMQSIRTSQPLKS